MMLPGMIVLILFSIVPLVGSTLAFQNFMPGGGFFRSPFVGWDNFKMIFMLPDTKQVIYNTVVISLLKALAHFPIQIFFAIALAEVMSRTLKKFVQTAVYLPHFISWVILAEVMRNLLSSQGLVNNLLGMIGVKGIDFLTSNSIFRYVLVGSDVWKEFGFGAIIYMAALTAINPSLYEACVMDGGSKLQQILHVTLPGLKSVIILCMVLSLGNILNTGFDQIFNLYNPMVYHVGDVLDTYVYRTGILGAQYSFATAIGLFKSVISLVLVLCSYLWAYKFADYRIF